jgi:GAF domain-containing protein
LSDLRRVGGAMMTGLSAQRLAQVFVEVADTLIDDFDVINFLRVVTSRTAELLDVAAVGLLLGDPFGELQFMAASDEGLELSALFEAQNHEGPSLEAFHNRRPVSCADLDQAAGRWPVFGPQALAAGFRAVHAFPMRIHGRVIGALSVLDREPVVLGHTEQDIVQSLVDVATIGLLQERTIRRSEVLTGQLQAALNSRVVIEQAKGVLSQFHRIGVDEASSMLIQQARRCGGRIEDVARRIVTDGPNALLP